MSDNNKSEYFCLKMIMKFGTILSEVHHVPMVFSYRLDGRQRFFGTNKAKAKFIETYLTSRSWKEAFHLDQDDLNQAENYSYFNVDPSKAFAEEMKKTLQLDRLPFPLKWCLYEELVPYCSTMLLTLYNNKTSESRKQMSFGKKEFKPEDPIWPESIYPWHLVKCFSNSSNFYKHKSKTYRGSLTDFLKLLVQKVFDHHQVDVNTYVDPRMSKSELHKRRRNARDVVESDSESEVTPVTSQESSQVSSPAPSVHSSDHEDGLEHGNTEDGKENDDIDNDAMCPDTSEDADDEDADDDDEMNDGKEKKKDRQKGLVTGHEVEEAGDDHPTVAAIKRVTLNVNPQVSEMIQQFDDDIVEDQDFEDKDGEPELEMDTDVEETKRDTPKLESIIEPKKKRPPPPLIALKDIDEEAKKEDSPVNENLKRKSSDGEHEREVITYGGGEVDPGAISGVCSKCKRLSSDQRVFGSWMIIPFSDEIRELCYACFHNLRSKGRRMNLARKMNENKHLAKMETEASTDEDEQKPKTEAFTVDNEGEMDTTNNNENDEEDNNASNYEELCLTVQVQSSSSSSIGEDSVPKAEPQQRLVEGDNDIEVLHIQPPVLPPMLSLPAQPPPPGGREVEGESRPPGPAPGQSQPPLPREPIIDGESEPGHAPARPMVPGEFTFALTNFIFTISRSNFF